MMKIPCVAKHSENWHVWGSEGEFYMFVEVHAKSAKEEREGKSGVDKVRIADVASYSLRSSFAFFA
jgi:hypothetical protein